MPKSNQIKSNQTKANQIVQPYFLIVKTVGADAYHFVKTSHILILQRERQYGAICKVSIS
jgi:hypothetical protein